MTKDDIFNPKMLNKEENAIINELSKNFDLDLNVAKLLFEKGIKSLDAAERFLSGGKKYFTDPFKIEGVTLSVEKIRTAISENQSIIIYGDYDADGICAVAILYLHLKKMGADVNWYIPDRTEGYGISIEAVEKIAEEFFPDLIITCDCGITAAEEIEYINSLGIDVIVTDHHEPFEIKPDCIIINPKLGADEDLKNLCGAGVAFKLIQALSGINETLEYSDIAAIATVADSVPLIGENRDIVLEGLKLFNTKPRPGICTLAKKFNLKEEYNSSTLAFMIAPRINAAGRIGNAERAIILFTETDDNILESTANELNDANSVRQEICDDILDKIYGSKEFKAQINNPILIIYGEDFAIGVLGIVASKLAERFNRPVFVCTLAEDLIKGSGRSIEKVNLCEMLNCMKDLFIKYGGHSQAAGITIKKNNYENFIKTANSYLKKFDYSIFNEEISAELKLQDLTLKFAKDLCKLEPFGVCNRRPKFLAENLFCEVMPIKNYINHITINDASTVITAFNFSDKLDLFVNGIKKYLVVDISVNSYNNRESVKCVLKNSFYDDEEGIPDEIIAVRYLDSFNRKQGETNFEIIKDYKPFLNEKYGTLFLTQNKESFLNFNHNIEKNIFNVINKNNNSKIILSPNLDADFSLFDKIVLLEKPNENFISELNRATRAKIYIIDNKVCLNLKNLDFSRELFGKYYRLIINNYKKIIYLNDIIYIYNCFKKFDKTIDLMQFCVCFNTFTDLKLLTIAYESGKIEITHNKVNLEDSAYLKSIKKLLF